MTQVVLGGGSSSPPSGQAQVPPISKGDAGQQRVPERPVPGAASDVAQPQLARERRGCADSQIQRAFLAAVRARRDMRDGRLLSRYSRAPLEHYSPTSQGCAPCRRQLSASPAPSAARMQALRTGRE